MLASSLLAAPLGATLNLEGGQSRISFDQSARLSATCEQAAASVRHFTQLKFVGDYDSSWSVQAILNNVPPSCSGTGLYTPCVAPDTTWPAFFFCQYSGQDDASPERLGPFRASRSVEKVAGQYLGVISSLDCPIPSQDALVRLSPAQTATLRLTILHHTSASDVAPLPFEGAAAVDDVLTFMFPAPPPPPSPPPSFPPSTPPRLPPSAPPPPRRTFLLGVADNLGDFYTADGAPAWVDIDGLSKTFTLDSNTKVLATFHYSAYSPAGNSRWIAATLNVDGLVSKESTSLVKGMHQVLDGWFVGELAAGTHTIKAQYSTNNGYSGGYNKPSDWWASRSLHIVALPAETLVHTLGASPSILPMIYTDQGASSSWIPMPNMAKSITLAEEKIVVCRFHYGAYRPDDSTLTWIASTLYVDDSEAKGSTSLVTAGDHNLLNGLYMGVLPAGSHTFAQMYRTSSGYANGYNDPTSWWQSRAMQILEFPTAEATVHVVDDLPNIDIPQSTNSWTPLAGMEKSITIVDAHKMVLCHFHVVSYTTASDQSNQWFASTLFIDGVEAHEVVGLQTYRHEMQGSTWIGQLDAGIHSFEVKFRTSSGYVGAYNRPREWWQTRSLQILELPF